MSSDASPAAQADFGTAAAPSSPTTDHDDGYKLLFAHAEMVRDLLVGFVDEPWVQELQFDTLQRVSASYLSDDLHDREGDIVWRVRLRGRWLYLYILLEFQSRPDRFMAVRMLGYVSLLYQDLIRQGPRAWGLDAEEANDPGGAGAGAAPPGGPPARPPSGERRAAPGAAHRVVQPPSRAGAPPLRWPT